MRYLRATSDEEMGKIGPGPSDSASSPPHGRRLVRGARSGAIFVRNPGSPGARTLRAGVERRSRESS
jgi:hypothetical protein